MKMLAKVEVEKMRQLADFLETVPPEDFDLEKWRTREPRAAIALGSIVFRDGCGFAGCAMGWAAHSQLFPGLRVNRQGDLCYRGEIGFDAAALVLGVTYSIAEFLFHDEFYGYNAITPYKVAQRVRRFAAHVEHLLAHKRAHPRLKVVGA